MYNLNDKFPDKYFKSLKESSKDTEKEDFMVENDFIVLKLDDYNKEEFQKEMKASMCLKGGDACFECNDILYIIEFKNRYLRKNVVFEVLEKMYASSIVIMDKLNIDIHEFRKNVKFVTVYTFDEVCDEKTLYEEQINIPHKGLTRIKMGISSKSTKKIKNIDEKAFTLKKLEKNLYNEVCAIPVNYFQRFLKEENII